MKKNNKGYLLTETLIVITVVATVITMIFAFIMNYYVKQEDEVTKFNTTEGLYIAKQIERYFSGYESDFILKFTADNDNNAGYADITDDYSGLNSNLNIRKIYFAKNSNMDNLIKNENFTTVVKKNLAESQDLDTNNCDYRYLIIFNDNSYSTIGVFCDR